MLVALSCLVACSGSGEGGDGIHEDAGMEDAGFACGAEPAAPTTTCRETVGATVTRVVDGDTIDVAIDGGADEAVRLLGIDAPESSEGDCGDGATEWLRARLPAGTHVTLAFDADCLDRYGRTLAYVRDSTGFVNADLVSEGQAQACPYEPNTSYADFLECLEEAASTSSAGLWEIGCHLDGCFN